MARSYLARYWSTGAHCLLGAVRSGRTCRYATREQAVQALERVIDINGPLETGSGAMRCAGEVVPSEDYPEIFVHCGKDIPQAIGGRCFGCGKLLGAEDARIHADRGETCAT